MREEASDIRSSIADEYLVESVAFVPVLGGVIEYGTSPGKDSWQGPNGAVAALEQTIPNEEIEAAFSKGASYMMFWKKVPATGMFRMAASYELPKNALTKMKDTDQFF